MSRNGWIVLFNIAVIVISAFIPSDSKLLVCLISLIFVNAVIFSVVLTKKKAPASVSNVPEKKSIADSRLFKVAWLIAVAAALYWVIEPHLTH